MSRIRTYLEHPLEIARTAPIACGYFVFTLGGMCCDAVMLLNAGGLARFVPEEREVGLTGLAIGSLLFAGRAIYQQLRLRSSLEGIVADWGPANIARDPSLRNAIFDPTRFSQASRHVAGLVCRNAGLGEAYEQFLADAEASEMAASVRSKLEARPLSAPSEASTVVPPDRQAGASYLFFESAD